MRWIRVEFVCVFVLLTMATGCQSLHAHRLRKADREDEDFTSDVRVISVSGSEVETPVVDLPFEGLTLAQVVARVGGPLTRGLTSEEVTKRRQNTLVALYRDASETGSEVYYIPLSLVEHDVAGRIILSPDEHIAFVDWRQTSLKLMKLGKDRRFAVLGIVERPGTYITHLSDDQGRQNLMRISHISTAEAAGAARIDDTEATLISLSRQNKSGINEYFLIPFPIPAGVNDEMLDAFIADGDTFLFTQLERLPIVLSSLLAPMVREELPIQRRRTILDQTSQSSSFLRLQLPPLPRTLPNPLPGLLPSLR